MLEKWQCHHCEKGFLLIDEDAKEKEVHCPFCGSKGSHVEAVAGQVPEDDYRNEMGCLWPGYNDFDKVGYLVGQGKISQDQAREYLNARFRGEKPEIPS